MKFEILPFHKLQGFENTTDLNHIVIRYISPGIDYHAIEYSKNCQAVMTINCHDIESPTTPFNAQVLKDYPHFYKEPLIYFDEDMAKNLLNFVREYLFYIDLIVCQCHAGISRSSATAAALSKILNRTDMWVFENDHFIYSSGWSVNERWVPNNLIYRTILKMYYEEKKNEL